MVISKQRSGKSILITCILLFLGVLLLYSPGKTQPYLDESGKPLAGSISEKILVNINGVEQGMFLKSKNATNPVLHYLHGGLPEYFLTQKWCVNLKQRQSH
jgi:hypothetical protein